MKSFLRELERLNTNQRLAVDTIEGPVMVMAGPGTGKTQVVALRIANILQKTQMKPQNILALTFTEAGVTALRQRLVDFVGTDAYLVTIATFHGFANEVIGTFPHIFPQVRSGSNLTELERLAIIEDILDSQHIGSVLRPLRKSDFFVTSIARSIKEAKQENITPESLEEAVKNLDENQADLTKIECESIARKKLTLTEFAGVFRSYNHHLEENLLYDYEDMILFVLEALKNSPEIKAHFQERYQYILVDEYQDSNTAQNQLVETLADFFDSPNLFVVGDDKQAIYRFQGASVSNMLHFHKKYPEMQLISLKENYRSTPEILSVADRSIKENHSQLKNFLKKNLVELEATLPSGLRPQIITADSPLLRDKLLVEKIQKAKNSGLDYAKIAVIYRRNADVKRVRLMLEKLGIPTSGERSAELMSEPLTRQLILALRAVENPLDDVAVLACSKLLTNKNKLTDLYATSRAHARSRSSLIEVMSKSTVTHIKKTAQKILDWNQRSAVLPLFQLLEEVVGDSGILNQIRSNNHGLADLDLIKSLLDFAYDFSIRNQEARLVDWLRHLSLTKKYQQAFTVARNDSEGGVKVSTVHGVKGLEFDLVIMADVDDKRWTTRAMTNLIELPSELIGLKDWHEDTIEDERRLFYVGITRSKKELLFILSKADVDGRDLLPCQFLSEIEGSCDESTFQATTLDLADFEKKLILPDKAGISHEELDFIREKVREQGFSFTDLRAYTRCPRQYLLSRILKIPTLPSSALVYGNVVHKALEMFFREYKSYRTLPAKAHLLEHFHDALDKSLPVKDRAQFIGKGELVLSSFYDKFAASWKAPVGVEYTFSPHKVMLNDIWLTGKFDRIDLLSGSNVRVIDYKTSSKAKSRNVIEGKTKNSEGEIKQQLVYYSLLAKHDRLFPYTIKDLEVVFVDDELTFKSEVFEITNSEIAELEKRIVDTYQEILTRENFPHTGENFESGCELCELFTD